MSPILHPARAALLLVIAGLTLTVVACGAAATPTPATSAPTTSSTIPATQSAAFPTPTSANGSRSASPTASTDASSVLDPSGGTATGDIPDNAVFLTFHGGTPSFSIQYVEGWQVMARPGGVVIRDKDSSETVATVAAQIDVAGWVASTDLPALRAQANFELVKHDQVKVGSRTYEHLLYHLPAPPDPVTGKQVPSTVDRYYVPGPGALALVSLSTPDGVDNVDGFGQMIASFGWK